MPRTVINRWYIVLGAIIIQICLGAIYAWGVFVKPLTMEFGWSKTEVSLAFTIFLVAYAVFTIFGGNLQDRVGPRKAITIGGLLLGSGYFLAGFTTNLPWLYLTYGLLGGAGVGIGYVCLIATCVKWFPDKRGLATGLAVAGFGAGALLIAPIASNIISNFGWRMAFQILGLAFTSIIILVARFIQNPPEDWLPEGFQKPSHENQGGVDFTWQQMLRTSQFWLIWLMFGFGATAGLMVIGHLAAYGTEVGLTETAAAFAVGTLSFFNGSGRVMWGFVSDKIGRLKALTIIYALLIVSVLAFVHTVEFVHLAIVAGFIGLAFGGLLAIFPSVNADWFGTKNVGTNYGFLFSAYGFAGVVGPLLAAQVNDRFGNYLYAAVIAAVLCAIAGMISLIVKKPEKPLDAYGRKSVYND